MLNICMVAHFAYDAVTGGNQGFIGGVERQMSLMAKWLVNKGHKVSLLTWSDGCSDDEVIDGINVIKICRSDSGFPGLRFFYPRWSNLNRALKCADADIYYQNCGEYVTGQVALWCQANNKKFLYSLASDADADPALPVLRTLRERVLYRYGLHHADHILAQTDKQVSMLKSGFDLSAMVMPMPCAGPTANEYQALADNNAKAIVLWVARIHPCKRLELLLAIAAQLSEYNFVIAGSAAKHDAYSQPLLETMARLDNVTYLGMVGREQMPRLYRSCTLLCCSSEYEGFPNTFLEAWSYGLPVVSTFDPDDLINCRQLGIATADKAGLITGIKTLCSDRELWQECADNARRYYQQNHAVDEVMSRFEDTFSRLSDPVKVLHAIN